MGEFLSLKIENAFFWNFFDYYELLLVKMGWESRVKNQKLARDPG